MAIPNTYPYVGGFHAVEVRISSDQQVCGSVFIVQVIVLLLAGSSWQEIPLLVDGTPAGTLMDYIAELTQALMHAHMHTCTHTYTHTITLPL